MDNDKREQMYYADIIASMAEKTIKRLWIALIAAIFVIAGMVGGFLWYLNQYDYEAYQYTQDGRGMNIIGTNALEGVNLYGADSEDYPQD